MQRTVRRHIAPLNAGKKQAVAALCQAYSLEKRYWLGVFEKKKFRHLLKHHRKVRDEAVKAKYMPKSGLQARQWKLALVDAAETWDKCYKATFKTVKALIFGRSDWTKEQKHYANWLLVNYDNVAAVLDHEAPVNPKIDLDEKARKAVSRWLYKAIRKHQGKQPTVKLKRSVVLDTDCYSVFVENGVQYLSIMGLTKGKRIVLPLKGYTAISGNIKIVIAKQGIEAHIGFELRTGAVDNDNKEAVDLGYTEVMTDTDGIHYGEGFGNILTSATERRHQAGKARNKLRALAERYEKSDNPKLRRKAKNIKTHNLGKKKWEARERRTKASIECKINQAINQVFREKQRGVLVTEHLRHAFDFGRHKAVNRKLSAWVKGTMQDRMEFKSMAEGFRHQAVNPAYGSQLCRACGCVDAKNRAGDKFRCRHCGHEDHADRNAALNYLDRADDAEITIYTPYKKVKEILLERFNRQLEAEMKAEQAVGASSVKTVTVQGRTPDTEKALSPQTPSMPKKATKRAPPKSGRQQQEGPQSRSNLTVTRRAKLKRDHV